MVRCGSLMSTTRWATTRWAVPSVASTSLLDWLPSIPFRTLLRHLSASRSAQMALFGLPITIPTAYFGLPSAAKTATATDYATIGKPMASMLTATALLTLTWRQWAQIQITGTFLWKLIIWIVRK